VLEATLDTRLEATLETDDESWLDDEALLEDLLSSPPQATKVRDTAANAANCGNC
jgi:hypothetical protein